MERVSCRHKNNQTYFSLLNDAVLSWWLMPIILATQEAEIRRIMVRRQPGQIVCKPLSQKYPTHKRASGVAQGEGPEFKPQYTRKRKVLM
jgi:hypothetical protein